MNFDISSKIDNIIGNKKVKKDVFSSDDKIKSILKHQKTHNVVPKHINRNYTDNIMNNILHSRVKQHALISHNIGDAHKRISKNIYGMGVWQNPEKLAVNRIAAQKTIPHKDMFKDYDHDGHLNVFDCQPWNRKKQGPTWDAIKGLVTGNNKKESEPRKESVETNVKSLETFSNLAPKETIKTSYGKFKQPDYTKQDPLDTGIETVSNKNVEITSTGTSVPEIETAKLGFMQKAGGFLKRAPKNIQQGIQKTALAADDVFSKNVKKPSLDAIKQNFITPIKNSAQKGTIVSDTVKYFTDVVNAPKREDAIREAKNAQYIENLRTRKAEGEMLQSIRTKLAQGKQLSEYELNALNKYQTEGHKVLTKTEEGNLAKYENTIAVQKEFGDMEGFAKAERQKQERKYIKHGIAQEMKQRRNPLAYASGTIGSAFGGLARTTRATPQVYDQFGRPMNNVAGGISSLGSENARTSAIFGGMSQGFSGNKSSLLLGSGGNTQNQVAYTKYMMSLGGSNNEMGVPFASRVGNVTGVGQKSENLPFDVKIASYTGNAKKARELQRLHGRTVEEPPMQQPRQPVQQSVPQPRTPKPGHYISRVTGLEMPLPPKPVNRVQHESVVVPAQGMPPATARAVAEGQIYSPNSRRFVNYTRRPYRKINTYAEPQVVDTTDNEL